MTQNSNMDTERLIECVKRHTFLYDVYHKEFKNFNLKTTVWELIGRELNQSGEAVKCKWKSIRDGYTKYKKNLNRTSRSSKKNLSYLWSSQLSFLDNIKPPSTYIVPETTVTPSSSFIQPSREYELSQDFMPLSSNLSPLLTQLETPSPDIANIASSSRVACLNEDAPSRRGKRKIDHGEQVFKHLNKKNRKVDGIDHLFLSYAETFKKFPPREKALVKLELAKLFSNTELKLLECNSNESQASSASPADSNSSFVDNTTLQEIIDNVQQPTEYCNKLETFKLEIKKEE